MNILFEKTKMLTDEVFHYCPGCMHGVAHRLIAECIDELGLNRNVVGVVPVGCAVYAFRYFNCDVIQAAHGRAPAVATGVKRSNPDNLVFTYQGDGDLAAIGTAEIMHAAARGEKFTTIFINNAIFGMTGGQMAPTTLEGQVTTTSPFGRDKNHCGLPLRMSETLATVEGAFYIERVSLHDVPSINKAKRAIKKAFTYQMEGKGFNFVELLANCPVNWKMTPEESLGWMKDAMIPYFPLGIKKEVQV